MAGGLWLVADGLWPRPGGYLLDFTTCIRSTLGLTLKPNLKGKFTPGPELQLRGLGQSFIKPKSIRNPSLIWNS